MRPLGSLPSLKERPSFVHWGVLLALTLLFSLLFDLILLPAALLLGAMLAAILVAVSEGTTRVSRHVFMLVQSVIGCLVARSITSDILVSLQRDWLLFASVTLIIVLACAGMGWILARRGVLPGTTAIWGSSPGGAAVMTLMSGQYGGDMRLVAVMQYLRVIIVTTLATLVSHFWIGSTAPHTAHSVLTGWFASAPDWIDLGKTMLLAAVAGPLAYYLKLPGGALLGTLVTGSVLQANGLINIVLPLWILAPTYILLGWAIGMRFTRQSVAQAARALPSMIVSILCLVVACGGIAVGLTHLAGIDPLTAYLATSPGGLDAVAVISASAGVNIPFVMSFQTARFLMVVFTGPALARFVAKRLQTDATP